ncbi:MAG: hypothetical protein AB1644_03145 [Candidatus Zixiibacteriota bacterium]
MQQMKLLVLLGAAFVSLLTVDCNSDKMVATDVYVGADDSVFWVSSAMVYDTSVAKKSHSVVFFLSTGVDGAGSSNRRC